MYFLSPVSLNTRNPKSLSITVPVTYLAFRQLQLLLYHPRTLSPYPILHQDILHDASWLIPRALGGGSGGGRCGSGAFSIPIIFVRSLVNSQGRVHRICSVESDDGLREQRMVVRKLSLIASFRQEKKMELTNPDLMLTTLTFFTFCGPHQTEGEGFRRSETCARNALRYWPVLREAMVPKSPLRPNVR
jgi:hypothetical protein